MKKFLGVICIAVAVAHSGMGEEEVNNSVFDQVGKLGVGYQGTFMGDLIGGVSVRYAPTPIGGQIEFAEGGIKADDIKLVDAFMLKGKLYYSLIQRQNSAFYLGVSAAWYKAELIDDNMDLDGWSIAPLMGAEYRFSELPELGLNFEVSYEFNKFCADDYVDIELRGIGISTGIVYYF